MLLELRPSLKIRQRWQGNLNLPIPKSPPVRLLQAPRSEYQIARDCLDQRFHQLH